MESAAQALRAHDLRPSQARPLLADAAIPEPPPLQTRAQAQPRSQAGPPDLSAARLLAHRATFGATEETLLEIAQLGHRAWLARQLAPGTIDDGALDAKLAAYPWLHMPLHAIITGGLGNVVVLADRFKGIRLLRAAESKRQLLERVVEFWEDHFHVAIGRVHRFVEDELVWRRFALGRFRDLLRAVTTSASMVTYLGNQRNHVGAVNENLAREVLELHTLGVDGPYTEDDVREFTRVLTGWNYDQDWTAPTFGDPLFVSAQHDFAPKRVLGMDLDGTQGQGELFQVLDFLADHPVTIRFVVGKMARHFLGEDPPEQALRAAAGAWARTGGEIRAVVAELLSPASITAAAGRRETKFVRPMRWMASMLRRTGMPAPAPDDALEHLRRLGHAPFEWGPPDGYPDERDAWNGLVASRWGVAASFARPDGGGWAHSSADLVALVAGRPRNQWLAALGAWGPAAGIRRADAVRIQQYLSSLPTSMPDAEALGEAIELLFSAPSDQVF